MIKNDRKALLREEATERIVAEMASFVQSHENMGRLYHSYCLEEDEYIENVLADMYKSICGEMKGVSE